MNKKMLSSCLALSICFMAMAPISKQSNLNSSNTVHPITEWNTLSLEKASSLKQQLLSTDDTATYPQNEEKVTVLEVKDQPLSSRAGTTTKKSTVSAATNKPVTSTRPKIVTATKPRTTATSTVKRTTSALSTAKPITNKTSTTSIATTSRGTSTVSSSKASAVISTAKSFIGVPYVWGGVSPSGFDCSGFTQYVLKKNGISVPRTAAEQYTVGTSVSKSNLRIGDLVFFTTYKAGASHLGFYAGNGNFVHASSSKGVTTSSLSSTYYSSHYIGARRVIN